MNLYTRTHGLFLIVIFLLSWVQKPVNQHNEPNGKNGTSLSEVMKDTTVYSLDTTMYIGKGFEIYCKQDEFSDNENGSLLVVKHNNKPVYINRSNFFVLNDSLNPTIIELGDDLFEIFLEIDDRPNRNFLQMLKIQLDKVIDSQKIPKFFHNPYQIVNGKCLFVGMWDYSEGWTNGKDSVYSTYNPYLYYEITKTGIVLDSAVTRKINKEIYGDFYGYTEDSKLVFPAQMIDSNRNEESK